MENYYNLFTFSSCSLFICLGLSIVPINDALAKFLSSDLNIFEIIWARFFGHFMFLVPLAYFINGKESFINKETGPQIVRGLMIFAGTAFFYFAIAHIPLANALSLLLIAPIIVVFLSSQFLNEKISKDAIIKLTEEFEKSVQNGINESNTNTDSHGSKVF